MWIVFLILFAVPTVLFLLMMRERFRQEDAAAAAAELQRIEEQKKQEQQAAFEKKQEELRAELASRPSYEDLSGQPSIVCKLQGRSVNDESLDWPRYENIRDRKEGEPIDLAEMENGRFCAIVPLYGYELGELSASDSKSILETFPSFYAYIVDIDFDDRDHPCANVEVFARGEN